MAKKKSLAKVDEPIIVEPIENEIIEEVVEPEIIETKVVEVIEEPIESKEEKGKSDRDKFIETQLKVINQMNNPARQKRLAERILRK